MAAKRTFWTKLNHDDARLAIDMMDDAEVGRWFRGWLAGAGGKEYQEEKVRAWPVEMRTGFAAGRESFAEAEKYSEKQRERVSKRYRGSTTVESGSDSEGFGSENATGSLPSNSQQPTANREQQQLPPKPPKGERVDPVMAEDIESIYDAYPRKEGKKAAVEKIRIALRSVPFDQLLEAVHAYAAAVAKWPIESRQYIPHPATWFSQGRWSDDRSTWESRASQGFARGRGVPSSRSFADQQYIEANRGIKNGAPIEYHNDPRLAGLD